MCKARKRIEESLFHELCVNQVLAPFRLEILKFLKSDQALFVAVPKTKLRREKRVLSSTISLNPVFVLNFISPVCTHTLFKVS